MPATARISGVIQTPCSNNGWRLMKVSQVFTGSLYSNLNASHRKKLSSLGRYLPLFPFSSFILHNFTLLFMRIGFIGSGKMASALIEGILRADIARPSDIVVTDKIGAAGGLPCQAHRRRRTRFERRGREIRRHTHPLR